MISDPRHQLLDVYAAALRAVEGRRLVHDYLGRQRLTAPVYLVAIGKAAPAMAQGAVEALGPQLQQGLVITKHGYGETMGMDPRLLLLEAAHPVPDAASLVAGAALLDFLQQAPAAATLLFLISGGASALVEVLPAGMDLGQWQAVNGWLLASGWDIARINRVRRALSRIKGGRLAGYLQGRTTYNLLLSDVPGDNPGTIGSGLLVAAEEEDRLTPFVGLPAHLSGVLPAAPPAWPDAKDFAPISTIILGSNHDACIAAVAAGHALGVQVYAAPGVLQGDATECGRAVAAQVRDGAPGLYVWGGETTVQLPPTAGRGGRCQQLALAAAEVIAGQNTIYLLAAGTDGSDGPTEEAGALVDGGTLERAALEGLSAADYLRRADAGTFLEASGDLIQTGPTGSNVMDLVLALKTA